MMRHRQLCGSLFALSLVAAIHFGSTAAHAGPRAGEAEARALLQQFLRPGADAVALTQKLRPSSADYKAVFGDMAAKAEAAFKSGWDAGAVVVHPKEGQSELKLWSASTEELRSGAGAAREFPGGYAKVAPHLGKGLTFYRFKFVAPGRSAGHAYDGLVYVNGRWVIFPKPYRILVAEPEGLAKE
jgi:hypothetical protein